MQLSDKGKKIPNYERKQIIVTLILRSCYVQMYPDRCVFAITLCQAPFKTQEVSREQNMEAQTRRGGNYQ